MTKSHNTKNELQKDLCITSEQLTEQWKKGDLVSGLSYYVEDTNGYINALEYIDAGADSHFSISESVIKRIIAPVPTFEEWEQLQNWTDFTNDYHELREKLEIAEYKNAQLKELLKECRPALVRFVSYDESEENARILLMNKIDEVLK